jgi:excisionase family DNA binding protein
MVCPMLYADPVLTTEVAATQSKHNGSPHVPHRSELPVQERLLNAREVAARLGVSERWVRDHTTRRSPKIRGVKLGTLMRYRHADVEEFMEKLTTSHSSLQPRLGAS